MNRFENVRMQLEAIAYGLIQLGNIYDYSLKMLKRLTDIYQD